MDVLTSNTSQYMLDVLGCIKKLGGPGCTEIISVLLSKDALDVSNTSNTTLSESRSNTSHALKNGKMYSSVLKNVSDVLFSWQDVLNDVLVLMIAPGPGLAVGCIN